MGRTMQTSRKHTDEPKSDNASPKKFEEDSKDSVISDTPIEEPKTSSQIEIVEIDSAIGSTECDTDSKIVSTTNEDADTKLDDLKTDDTKTESKKDGVETESNGFSVEEVTDVPVETEKETNGHGDKSNVDSVPVSNSEIEINNNTADLKRPISASQDEEHLKKQKV